MCRQWRERALPKADRKLGRVFARAWWVVVALLAAACGSSAPPTSHKAPPQLTTTVPVPSAPSAGQTPSTLPAVAGQHVRFERISIEQGLSHSTVNCILQDSKGFMWLGTNDGLNRYDGHDFTLYKHVPSDPHSLSHNHIKSLHQDQFGTLWVGTVDRLGDDWH